MHRLRGEQWESFTSREGLPSDIVLALFEDRERNVWVGTREGLLTTSQGQLAVFTTRDGLANDFVTALQQSRDGALWVGTRLGLDRIQNGRATPAAFSARLPRDTVLSLLEDRSGILWVGTRHGLFVVKDGRTEVLTTADGLHGNYVSALAEARSGGIWVGTRSGLNLVKDGRVGPAIAPLPVQAEVTAVHESRDGGVWIGTSLTGPLQLQNGHWRPYDTPEGLARATVTSLAEDADSLWITTRQGLARLTEGGMRLYHAGARLAHPIELLRRDGRPRTLDDDAPSSLLVTSEVGIFRVEKQSFDDVDAGRRPQPGSDRVRQARWAEEQRVQQQRAAWRLARP